MGSRKLRQALLFVGINPAGFSGHSFRRGAAHSALKAGISRKDIMKMGRWKSDSVDQYFSLTTANKLLFSLSTQLHAKPGPPNIASDSRHTLSANSRIHMHMLRCNAKFEIGHSPSARAPG